MSRGAASLDRLGGQKLDERVFLRGWKRALRDPAAKPRDPASQPFATRLTRCHALHPANDAAGETKKRRRREDGCVDAHPGCLEARRKTPLDIAAAQLHEH